MGAVGDFLLEINTSLSKMQFLQSVAQLSMTQFNYYLHALNPRTEKVQLNGGQLAILKPEMGFLTSS